MKLKIARKWLVTSNHANEPKTRDTTNDSGSKWRFIFETQHRLIEELQETVNFLSRDHDLPEFDPIKNADPVSWCATVDMHFDIERMIYVSRALKGSAATWLSEVAYPGLTWTRFKELFIKHFQKNTAILINLKDDKATDSESLEEYASRMIKELMNRFKEASTEQIVVSIMMAHLSQFKPNLKQVAEIDTIQQLDQELHATDSSDVHVQPRRLKKSNNYYFEDQSSDDVMITEVASDALTNMEPGRSYTRFQSEYADETDSRTSQSDSVRSKPASSSENEVASDSSREAGESLPPLVEHAVLELRRADKGDDVTTDMLLARLDQVLPEYDANINKQAWTTVATILNTDVNSLKNRVKALANLGPTDNSNIAPPIQPSPAHAPKASTVNHKSVKPPPNRRKQDTDLSDEEIAAMTQHDRNQNVEKFLKRLQELIKDKKPAMISIYNAECDKFQDAGGKGQRPPKRRFPWCAETRALLRALTRVSGRDDLLARRVLPLFPKGFVSLPALLRQAQVKADMKRQKPVQNSQPASITQQPMQPFTETIQSPSSLTGTATVKQTEKQDNDIDKPIESQYNNIAPYVSIELLVEKSDRKHKDTENYKEERYSPNGIGSTTITPVVAEKGKEQTNVQKKPVQNSQPAPITQQPMQPFTETIQFPSSLTGTATAKQTEKQENDIDKPNPNNVTNKSFESQYNDIAPYVSIELLVEKSDRKHKDTENSKGERHSPNSIGSITITPVVAEKGKKQTNVPEKKKEPLIRVESPAALTKDDEMVKKNRVNKLNEIEKKHSHNKEKRVNSRLFIDTNLQTKYKENPSPNNKKDEIKIKNRTIDDNIARPALIPVQHSLTKPDEMLSESKKKRDVVMMPEVDFLLDNSEALAIDDCSSDVDIIGEISDTESISKNEGFSKNVSEVNKKSEKVPSKDKSASGSVTNSVKDNDRNRSKVPERSHPMDIDDEDSVSNISALLRSLKKMQMIFPPKAEKSDEMDLSASQEFNDRMWTLKWHSKLTYSLLAIRIYLPCYS